MNNGQVVEYDPPYKLLQERSSLFYKMVEKTGPEASRELHDMAKRPE
jgi:predicted secreted protein